MLELSPYALARLDRAFVRPSLKKTRIRRTARFYNMSLLESLQWVEAGVGIGVISREHANQWREFRSEALERALNSVAVDKVTFLYPAGLPQRVSADPEEQRFYMVLLAIASEYYRRSSKAFQIWFLDPGKLKPVSSADLQNALGENRCFMSSANILSGFLRTLEYIRTLDGVVGNRRLGRPAMVLAQQRWRLDDSGKDEYWQNCAFSIWSALDVKRRDENLQQFLFDAKKLFDIWNRLTKLSFSARA